MAGLETGRWPGFIARVATPAIPREIAADLAEGWPAVIGGEIPGGTLLATLAQILLETGTREGPDALHQAAGYWNGNAGNIRGTYLPDGGAAPAWWTSFRAGEGFGANEVILEPGPNNRFRSYIGPTEDPTNPDVLREAKRRGIRDYLSLLNRKYARALERAAARDYHGYVQALHDGGYFTADVGAYDRAEERLRHTVENLPQVAAFLVTA